MLLVTGYTLWFGVLFGQNKEFEHCDRGQINLLGGLEAKISCWLLISPQLLLLWCLFWDTA